MTAIEKILAAFDRAGCRPKAYKDYWMVYSPLRDEQNPSLAVSESDDGKVLILDYGAPNGKLDTPAIMQKIGLTMADLFPSNGHNKTNGYKKPARKKEELTVDWSRPGPVYFYNDQYGEPYLKKQRYPMVDQAGARVKDTYIWSHWDGKSWQIGNGGRRSILYNLKALIEARPGHMIMLCEGEKDADNLAKAGFLTTTKPSTPEDITKHIDCLKNHPVTLFEDNDEAGHGKVLRDAQALYPLTEVKIITPRLGGWHNIKSGDVSDVIADLELGEIQTMVNNWIRNAPAWAPAPDSEPEPRPGPEPTEPTHKTQWTADELLTTEFSEPTWTVPEILPEGLGILAGRPKLGKSWLALQWSGAVGVGGVIFGKQVKKGKVLYLALEDNPRRLKKRMKAQHWIAGSQVVFETEWPDLVTENGLAKLQATIAQEGYTFIIIDTLSRAVKFKQGSMEESTDVLSQLHTLAKEFVVTILVIDHHRKPGLNGVDDVIDSVIESTGKTATADSIIGLYRTRGEKFATLKATGRDLEEDKNLAIKFDGLTCSWQLLGEANEIITNEPDLEIMQAIADLAEATQQNIVELTGHTKGYVSKILNNLREKKMIVWEGKGKPYALTPLGKMNLERT